MTIDSNNTWSSNQPQTGNSCGETNFSDAINQAVIQGIGFALGGIVVVVAMKLLRVKA